MCEPATIIAVTGLVISAAGATAGVIGQQQQAQATARYQNKSVDAANANAITDFQQRNAANQASIMQGDAQATEKKDQNNIALAKAKSTTRLGAAEGGIEGNSVDALYADFDRQNGEYNSSVDANNANSRAQAGYAAQGQRAQGQSFLNGFMYAPIQKPDYFGAAAQLGAGGLAAYDRYQINRKPDANRSAA